MGRNLIQKKNIEEEKCIKQQEVMCMRTREAPHKKEDKENMLLQNEALVDTQVQIFGSGAGHLATKV